MKKRIYVRVNQIYHYEDTLGYTWIFKAKKREGDKIHTGVSIGLKSNHQNKKWVHATAGFHSISTIVEFRPASKEEQAMYLTEMLKA